MAEHILRGAIAIVPREEGGRHLVVNDTGEIYRIPLPPDALEELRESLNWSDDELAERIGRQDASRSIVLPGQNGRASGPSQN